MSTIASAVHAAHSLATSILATAQIEPGASIPEVKVKENAPGEEDAFILPLTGKNIIIGVPGAFTTPCNGHIPPWIKKYADFKAKGVNEIYVVAVNDTFVTKAWKESLAPVEGTSIRFIADDKGAFVSALGLIFDASKLLGGPRSKRFAIVVENGKVLSVAVEKNPPDVTVTSAEAVLATL